MGFAVAVVHPWNKLRRLSFFIWVSGVVVSRNAASPLHCPDLVGELKMVLLQLVGIEPTR